jgi:lipopolysaccharide export system permease protein
MRLLARYLLRECLIALGYCFSAFLILWIAFDLFSELSDLQNNKLRAGDIVEFYIYKIPEFLPIALPVALLLALLYSLSNHARYNEITAIRAAGVSLWRLSLPYFSVGLVATVALFLSNEFVAPGSAEIAEQILVRRIQPRQSTEQRQQIRNCDFRNTHRGEDRSWHIGTYNLQSGGMIQVVVDWQLPDGSKRSLFAEHAAYTNKAWNFFRVREIRQAAGTNSAQLKLPPVDVLAFPEFSETPAMFKSAINLRDRFDNQARSHRADVPIKEILNFLHLNPRPQPATFRSWLFTKLHGRFAGPCTCFIVVLLAVPFAAGSGRRNVFVGVAASIFIFFMYYLLQQLGFAFGETGHIPGWVGAWFPNLFFGIASLWMMARVR